MDIHYLLKYDNKLFSILKDKFSKEYPDKFANDKLYDTWGRKCNFIINFLKIISKDSKKECIKKAISIIMDFLINKDIKTELKYLTSFNSEIFDEYKKEILKFRNNLSSEVFNLIYLYEFEMVNDDKLLFKIRNSIKKMIYDYHKPFIGLFELVKYSLSDKADIFIEFISLINNNNIMQKIVENKFFDLNSKQKEFILNNKFNLKDAVSYLEELKKNVPTNDEILSEIMKVSKKNKKKKNKNKKLINSNIENNDKGTENSDKNGINILDNATEIKNNEIVMNNVEATNDENNIKTENVKNKENVIIIDEEKTKNSENNTLNEKLQIEELKQEIDRLNKIIERIQFEALATQCDLENKIDILETKLNMICYRDMIKDIINYSYTYFNHFEKKKLSKKISPIVNSLKAPDFDLKQKKIFSNFLNSSFFTLVTVNKNVHEGDYVENYSVKNFIKCLIKYAEISQFDILPINKKNCSFNLIKMIPSEEEILPILKKIGFIYEDEFIYYDE